MIEENDIIDDFPPELVDISNNSILDDLNDNNINIKQKIPITILTGFLGSGKTTLLSYILSANHNKRIAVIENEFSEGLGIETLIATSNVSGNNLSDFIELPNGCICCTIKDNLIVTLEKLIEHQDKFDYILIEMTGLANPGPVISSFWLDDAMNTTIRLDGVICVVDGYNIEKYLNNSDISNEIIKQISFADRILLNKCDLISNDQMNRVYDLIKGLNSIADIYQTTYSEVSCDWILDINGLDIRKAYNDTISITSQFSSFCEPCSIPMANSHINSNVNTYSVIFNNYINLIAFQKLIDSLIYDNNTNNSIIYRMKGVLHLQGSNQLFILQAVHDIFDIKPIDILIDSLDDTSQGYNKIIIIGSNLSIDYIRENMIACCNI